MVKEDSICLTAKVGAKLIKMYIASYIILNIIAMMYTVALAPQQPREVSIIMTHPNSSVTVPAEEIVRWGVNYLLAFNIGNAYLMSAFTSAITGAALYSGLRAFSRAADEVKGEGLGKAPLAVIASFAGAAAIYAVMAVWARFEVHHAYIIASKALGHTGELSRPEEVANALVKVGSAITSLPVFKASHASAGIMELFKGLAAAAAYLGLGRVLRGPHAKTIAALFIAQGAYEFIRQALILSGSPLIKAVTAASGFMVIIIAGRLLLQWSNASSIAKSLCRIKSRGK